jgi:putative transposase
MDCVGCSAAAVTERPDLAALGYRRFRCRDCDKPFNERSSGVLNRASLPSDVIAFVVFCRLRYRLTLRDLSEIMLFRGFTVSHECLRRWEAKLLPVMGEALRKRHHGTGRSAGSVCRWNLPQGPGPPVPESGPKVLASARSVASFVPDRVTIDAHDSYPREVRSTLGRNVRHSTL